MRTPARSRPRRKPATFVLVHGAWHGGWCWVRVVDLLRGAGHRVYTPTLTGLGERVHLAHPGIDLTLHVQDVLSLLATEELTRVILVGHSYGGMVITAVASRAASRLSNLVYLDAFVPADGQALLDLVPPEAAAGMRAVARERGDGWRIPPFSAESLRDRYGLTNPKDRAWVLRHLVPQPLRTFEQPVEAGGAERLRRTYIYCCKPSLGGFDQFVRFKGQSSWRFHELRTGHDAMVAAPREVARILLDMA